MARFLPRSFARCSNGGNANARQGPKSFNARLASRFGRNLLGSRLGPLHEKLKNERGNMLVVLACNRNDIYLTWTFQLKHVY